MAPPELRSYSTAGKCHPASTASGSRQLTSLAVPSLACACSDEDYSNPFQCGAGRRPRRRLQHSCRPLRPRPEARAGGRREMPATRGAKLRPRPALVQLPGRCVVLPPTWWAPGAGRSLCHAPAPGRPPLSPAPAPIDMSADAAASHSPALQQWTPVTAVCMRQLWGAAASPEKAVTDSSPEKAPETATLANGKGSQAVKPP